MSNREVALAFQGALGAFSHQAASAFAEQLGCHGRYLPSQTFGEVFEQVRCGKADYGVIPLENSSIGSIVANYDLLWNNNAVVVAEYFLPVHHHLIGHPGTKPEEVHTVYSHPAALDQCRRLFKQYPNMAARVFWDTSGSVAHVKELADRTAAAIAGEPAAREYGMAILLANIEDYPHNSTRFGLIVPGTASSATGSASAARADSFEANAAAARAAPTIKTSWAVELAHKSGTLARLLQALAETGANLTKIESRPIGETPWHYRFFLDMELPRDVSETAVAEALKASAENYKLLGRYAPALRATAGTIGPPPAPQA